MCGFVSENNIRETTRGQSTIGKCMNCTALIFSIPTQKYNEKSKSDTISKGEKREKILADIYLRNEGGGTARKRPSHSDIDMEIIDELGNVSYFLEIKERSNSINAYPDTKFPYAKIAEAKRLIKETGRPVVIVLKFVDCWTRIRVDVKKEYFKGNEPFYPNYRQSQKDSSSQVPVLIPIEELEVLSIREECKDAFK